MSRSLPIAGKALTGKGMNDTIHPKMVLPGQYRKLLNGRIGESNVPIKHTGRELIVTLPDTVREIIAPNRKTPLKTYNSANNSLKFRDDETGASYVARLTPGDYYTHTELAQALEDAMNEAEDNGWVVTFTETESLPATANTGAWAPPKPVLDPIAHPTGITDVEIGTFRLDLHPGASTTRAFADFASTGILRIGDEEIYFSAAADVGDGRRVDFTIPADGRARNGTVAAAHAASAVVRPLYSAYSTAFTDVYLFWGAAGTNKLDADGDGAAETDGYVWDI